MECTCQLCLRKLPNTSYVLNCGHLAFCSRCSLNLVQEGKKCPICKSSVWSRKPVKIRSLNVKLIKKKSYSRFHYSTWIVIISQAKDLANKISMFLVTILFLKIFNIRVHSSHDVFFSFFFQIGVNTKIDNLQQEKCRRKTNRWLNSIDLCVDE